MKLAAPLAMAVLALRADAAVVRQSTHQQGSAGSGVMAKVVDSGAASAAALETARSSWHFLLPSPTLRFLQSAYGGHAVSFTSLKLPEHDAADGPHIVVDGGTRPSPSLVNLVASIVIVMSFAIWGGLVYLVGSKYLEHVKVKPSQTADGSVEEDLMEFKHGLCGCLSAPKTSFWAFCCPFIRWADSISTMGILRSFWLALLVWYGMAVLNADQSVQGQQGAGFSNIMPMMLFALLGAGFRHELRLKFKMATGAKVFFLDAIAYGCCSCCAIVQDAQQVDEAAQLGHPAVAAESKESA